MSFRARMLEARLAPSTVEVYTRATQELRAEGFPISYAGLLRYYEVATLRGNRSVGYMRTVKCAALFLSRLGQADETISTEQAADLDQVLQGMAVLEAERRDDPLRGSIDEDQLEQLVDLAHERNLPDIGDGFVVLFGVGCRPRDIAEITGDRIDWRNQTVTVRSKRRRYLQAQNGAWEEHPIRTDGASLLLARRARKHNGPLFPGWTTARASRLVKEAAEKFGWSADLKWDGSHCLRHGAAGSEMAKALQTVRVAGGWATAQSAAHYARSNTSRRRAKKN